MWGYSFVAPTAGTRREPAIAVGSGYWGNDITSGTTLYITKNHATTANLTTDWEIHGQKQSQPGPGGQFSKVTARPGLYR